MFNLPNISAAWNLAVETFFFFFLISKRNSLPLDLFENAVGGGAEVKGQSLEE